MRTLEKGLTHHHSKCRTISMHNADGRKATTDEENAQLPLPCNHTTLDLIKQHANYACLVTLPYVQEVCAALCHMVNCKAPSPSDITSNALKSMVWIKENPEDEFANDDADYLATVIYMMILEFWECSFDFQSWESGTLTPVPKKGDLSNPNKWCQFACLKLRIKITDWSPNVAA
eukprot:12725256-Ditylum_brightwellii.AAC.1